MTGFGEESRLTAFCLAVRKPTPDVRVKTPQIFASADRTVSRRFLADAKPVNFTSEITVAHLTLPS
jgi:hypothetical protein